MAQCKKSAPEFIQDTFSPMISILCSHDAELVTQKNNLTFVELIQPFCRLNAEAHVRDPGNMPHPVRNLRINMNDMNQHPPQPTLARKMMSEVVGNAHPVADLSRNNVITVGDYDLQLSDTTPWYEAFRECFINVAYPTDHEFTRHYLACMFIVSSSHADPMDQFGKLTQQQHLQQHQQPHKLPKWFCPNILRYYLLLHDVSDEQEAKAESVYQTMKSTYGVNACHLLQINSRSASDPLASEQGTIPDPWSQFLRKKSTETDLAALDPDYEGGQTPLREVGTFPGELHEGTYPEKSTLNIDSAMEVTENINSDSQSEGGIVIDHPLAPNSLMTGSSNSLDTFNAPVDNAIPRDSQNNPIPPSSVPVGTSAAPTTQHGGCLTLSDHDRIRIFVHEFIVRGLIPWAERMLRSLSDQMTNRKGIGRNLFSATKKWFGSNKPNQGQTIVAEKTNVVYTSEAPEMQMRRLADLAFLFQLYEIAYQTYHQAKKDFNNDHAWLHYAGALEMASIAVFMQASSNQRQYPHHYMESAVTTYLSTCRAPQFATRATLLSTEALKSKGMYAEAAMQFIKMTSEDSDLRSALLLEQAAHCFIKMKQPMVRKYSFHMILAGHRFSKAGQRKHALRSYAQALQIYKGKSWALAEDHINFTIGRQSFNLKQLDNATAAFKHLLTHESKQSSPQQNAFLREYLFVYKQQLAQLSPETSPSGGELFQLPLPVVDGNTTKVLCCHHAGRQEGARVQASSVYFDSDESVNRKWKKLEELLLVSATGSIPSNFHQSLQCVTNRTINTHSPVSILGEPITVEVCLGNPLKIPLVLSNVVLLWKFVPSTFDKENENQEQPPSVVSNESGDSQNSLIESIVKSDVIPEIVLQCSDTKQVHLSLSVHQTGDLHLTGVAYNLSTNPTVAQSAPVAIVNPSTTAESLPNALGAAKTGQSISVRGRLNLDVQGPRLNNSKAEKTGKMYGPDRRLDLVIVPPMSRLEVCFIEMPHFMLCGEVRQVVVELKNPSEQMLTNVRLASTNPEFFTFDDARASSSNCDNNGVYCLRANTAETDFEETVADISTVKHVLSVPIPNSSIAPGQSVKLPMWIRGPDSSGTHSIDFLFYYESATKNPKLNHRVLRHTATVTVNHSLVLRASAQRTATCDRSPDEADDTAHPSIPSEIITRLEIENMNTIADSSITEFSILQVSCVSCEWHLQHLSTQRHSDIKISGKESTSVCFRARRCKGEKRDINQIAYTNVTFDQHQIDSARCPCADFYARSLIRTKFEDVEVEAPKPAHIPVPRPSTAPDFSSLDRALDIDLTLIVLWKAFQVDETSGDSRVIVGQHHVTIDKANDPVIAPSTAIKAPGEQIPVRIIQEVESLEEMTPKSEVTSQMIKYSLSYKQHVAGEFKNTRLVLLPIEVVMKNCTRSELDVEISTASTPEKSENSETNTTATEVAKHPSTQFTWSGQKLRRLSLPAESTYSLSLTACFCKPGVYDLSAVQVKAGPKRSFRGVHVPVATQKTSSPSLVIVHAQ